MLTENRFGQYGLNIVLPPALIDGGDGAPYAPKVTGRIVNDVIAPPVYVDVAASKPSRRQGDGWWYNGQGRGRMTMCREGRMYERTDKEGAGEKPGLLRHYRPVAIRSVVAAHAMIPKPRAEVHTEPPRAGMGFALPPGFHSPPDD